VRFTWGGLVRSIYNERIFIDLHLPRLTHLYDARRLSHVRCVSVWTSPRGAILKSSRSPEGGFRWNVCRSSSWGHFLINSIIIFIRKNPPPPGSPLTPISVLHSTCIFMYKISTRDPSPIRARVGADPLCIFAGFWQLRKFPRCWIHSEMSRTRRVW